MAETQLDSVWSEVFPDRSRPLAYASEEADDQGYFPLTDTSKFLVDGLQGLTSAQLYALTANNAEALRLVQEEWTNLERLAQHIKSRDPTAVLHKDPQQLPPQDIFEERKEAALYGYKYDGNRRMVPARFTQADNVTDQEKYDLREVPEPFAQGGFIPNDKQYKSLMATAKAEGHEFNPDNQIPYKHNFAFKERPPGTWVAKVRAPDAPPPPRTRAREAILNGVMDRQTRFNGEKVPMTRELSSNTQGTLSPGKRIGTPLNGQSPALKKRRIEAQEVVDPPPRKKHPNQYTKRREAEEAARLAAQKAAGITYDSPLLTPQSQPATPEPAKKKHPNQYTKRREREEAERKAREEAEARERALADEDFRRGSEDRPQHLQHPDEFIRQHGAGPFADAGWPVENGYPPTQSIPPPTYSNHYSLQRNHGPPHRTGPAPRYDMSVPPKDFYQRMRMHEHDGASITEMKQQDPNTIPPNEFFSHRASQSQSRYSDQPQKSCNSSSAPAASYSSTPVTQSSKNKDPYTMSKEELRKHLFKDSELINFLQHDHSWLNDNPADAAVWKGRILNSAYPVRTWAMLRKWKEWKAEGKDKRPRDKEGNRVKTEPSTSSVHTITVDNERFDNADGEDSPMLEAPSLPASSQEPGPYPYPQFNPASRSTSPLRRPIRSFRGRLDIAHADPFGSYAPRSPLVNSMNARDLDDVPPPGMQQQILLKGPHPLPLTVTQAESFGTTLRAMDELDPTTKVNTWQDKTQTEYESSTFAGQGVLKQRPQTETRRSLRAESYKRARTIDSDNASSSIQINGNTEAESEDPLHRGVGSSAAHSLSPGDEEEGEQDPESSADTVSSTTLTDSNDKDGDYHSRARAPRPRPRRPVRTATARTMPAAKEPTAPPMSRTRSTRSARSGQRATDYNTITVSLSSFAPQQATDGHASPVNPRRRGLRPNPPKRTLTGESVTEKDFEDGSSDGGEGLPVTMPVPTRRSTRNTMVKDEVGGVE